MVLRIYNENIDDKVKYAFFSLIIIVDTNICQTMNSTVNSIVSHSLDTVKEYLWSVVSNTIFSGFGDFLSLYGFAQFLGTISVSQCLVIFSVFGKFLGFW